MMDVAYVRRITEAGAEGRGSVLRSKFVSARALAENAFKRSGALHLLRFSNRHRLRVLMYHRFPGSDAEVRARLGAQCEHLRRWYHPVSVGEAADWLAGGRALPANSLAITVDDGYRDFHAAWDVFRSYGLKVTLFVVSRFVDRELWLWPDEVKSLFATTGLASVAIPLPDGTVFQASLGAQREAAAQALADLMVSLGHAERVGLLRELPRMLGTSLPAALPDRFAPLGWSELRRMAGEGLEVGAHTRSHPVLSRLATAEEVTREIAGSRADIEARLQRPVLHFCYPNGKRADYDERATGAVREAGYRTACNAEAGLNGAGADAMQLSRIGVDPGVPDGYFERRVAGYGVPLAGTVV